jgi:hypothetical protein
MAREHTRGTCDAALAAMAAPNPLLPSHTGPGQSGAASGAYYLDERFPETIPYPTRSLPQGSRSPVPGEDEQRSDDSGPPRSGTTTSGT